MCCQGGAPNVLSGWSSQCVVWVELPMCCQGGAPNVLSGWSSQCVVRVELPMCCQGGAPNVLSGWSSQCVVRVELPMCCQAGAPNVLSGWSSQCIVRVELPMCCQGGAPNVLSGWSSQCVVRVEHSCPPKLLLTPHFLDIVVNVDVTGPPHISKLWLGVNSDLLPVKYFLPEKSFVCVSCILWRSKECHKPEVKLAIVHFCGILPD